MIRLNVEGLPAPQGSKTAVRSGGKVRVIEGGSSAGRIKHKAWRSAVFAVAYHYRAGSQLQLPLTGPLQVVITFRFPRPQSTRPGERWKHTRPDIDKLCRSTLDSLTDAGLIEDDARIASIQATKVFVDHDERPGATIDVAQLS